MKRITQHRMSPAWLSLLEHVIKGLKVLGESRRLWPSALLLVLLMAVAASAYDPKEYRRLSDGRLVRLSPKYCTVQLFDGTLPRPLPAWDATLETWTVDCWKNPEYYMNQPRPDIPRDSGLRVMPRSK